MNLFQLIEYNLHISEEAYSLTPFKKLLDNDKSKDKEVAIKELSLVFFMSDIKSDYNYILNPKDKEEEIIKDLNFPKGWKLNKDVQTAISFYKDRSKTVSSTILENSLFIANTLSNKMRKLVTDEETVLSITEIKNISEGLSKMPGIVTALQKLEQTVIKEQSEKSSNVGSQEKALFEDGF
jgi:hypothetical protein